MKVEANLDKLMKYFIVIFIFTIFPLYLFAASPSAQEEIDLANRLHKQANSYSNQSQYEKAEPLFIRSIEILEKVFDPKHPAVATILSNLGLLYKRQFRFDEAEQLLKRSITIFEEAFGNEQHKLAIIFM